MSDLIPRKNKYLKKMTKQELEQQLENMPIVDKLFRRKFAVIVPAAYLYSEEDFARGVPVSGDKKRDARAAHELEQTFLPIAPDDAAPGPNLLEFFEQDIPCNFRYDRDVVNVYNILMEHFRSMAAYLNENPLISPEKRERILTDLQRFDALAAHLHGASHQILPKHLAADTIEHKLRMALKPKMGTSTLDAVAQEAEAPEYQSFATGISRHVLKKQGKKPWQ